MIKLSIIVPIYGVEQYLRKCVDSLLAQDLSSSEYEIILVDDGGTDMCPQICDEYARMNALVNEGVRELGKTFIKVIHQENQGLSAARNAGVKVAKGEYIMFVDSDDYLEANVLSGLVAQMDRDKLDVLRYRLQYVNPQYEVFNPYKSNPFEGNDYSTEPIDGVSFLNSRMGTQCYAWTFIIKRSLLVDSVKCTVYGDNCLFTEGIYFEDTDWTPRMLVRAQRAASTDTIVYNYLVRQGSITKAVDRKKQKKVLEDKMRLIGELQRQAEELHQQGKDNRWYQRMIAETVISIINILSTIFYSERKAYLERLRSLRVFPIFSREMKARLINFSPRLAVELLHIKHHK